MSAASSFPRPSELPRPAQILLDALDAAGTSAGSIEDACAALAASSRPSSPAAARAMLTAAAAAGALELSGDDFYPPGAAPTALDVEGERHERVLRIISFDVESAVRARVEDGGAVSRDVWEIGAARFGPDRAWVDEQAPVRRFVAMREGFEVQGHRAAEHAAHAVTPETAWTEFHQFACDADIIVAYNGSALDFRLLAAAFENNGLAPFAGELVDGLYLAHCLWPQAGSHALGDICHTAGVAAIGAFHNAADDAANLALLMEAAASFWQRRPDDLKSLIGSLTYASAAWRMLRALAAEPDLRVEHGAAAVMAIMGAELHGRPKRRGAAVVPLRIPDDVRSETGVVSPASLAQRLHGPHVEVRVSQQYVTDALLRAADHGRPVMIEAPTGTGKSLSALAAALEWVGRAPSHKAIIATYTKQLQNQLAREIELLSTEIPGLIQTTDLVKGASNRLSLRGLVYTLADATGGDVGGARHLIRHSNDIGFCELVAYLTLRLLTPVDTPSFRWAAVSVDQADLPPFFLDYCGRSVGLWLGTLSQVTHGEYRDTSKLELAQWTDEVREALANHRVIVANHALLLAHWEDLATDADDLLLLVDEAHALEGAATDALSPQLATADIDDVLGSLRILVRDLSGAAGIVGLRVQLDDFGNWWRDNRLRTLVAHSLDRSVGAAGAREGSRTLTLISPHTTAQAARDARTVSRLLAQLHGLSGRILAALGTIRASNIGTLDPFDEQRLFAAHVRVTALTGTCRQLHDAIEALLSAPAPVAISDDIGSVDNTSGEGDNDGEAVVRDDEDVQAADQVEEADAQGHVDGRVEDAPAQPEPSAQLPDETGAIASPAQGAASPDRVVFVREDGPIGTRGLTRYRFSIVSSPILLANDADWQSFLSTYRRLGLMSATLQVQTPGRDSWAYTRTRLGMADADVDVVSGPFDYSSQARLVAFDDFPSWAEQPKLAMRTVAHQLVGYAQHVIHRAEPTDSGDPSPWLGGAMVLTTSRNAASGIAYELGCQLVLQGVPTSVHDQTYLGTQRAVADFAGPSEHHGGFLVGTRGLWTGVDVSDPERMHLVWINKLPFPVFTDPVIAARREQVRRQAEDAGASDPDLVANSEYYLPLAALDLRQAVGRLIRNQGSRGVVVISDRKLGGELPLRRLYRQIFLGSLDPGLHITDTDTGEAVGGNVMSMTEGWDLIWRFLDGEELLDGDVDSLCAPDALERQTVLPSTLAIRQLALTDAEVTWLRELDTLEQVVLERAERAASLLSGRTVELRPEQRTAIAAAARGDDVLALLPTGYGKSYCFQLPALILPGLTIVISPLVSLMHNQAVNLNGTIGGAVRALVGSLPESSSRAGRTQVFEQMTNAACTHGIRIVYVSPERLGQARFRQALETGVSAGIIRRVAIDEAHAYVQWGEDFRPSFRRAGALLRELRLRYPQTVSLMTLTATATPTVEASLREEVLGEMLPTTPQGEEPGRTVEVVRVNPMRPELQLARRTLRSRGTHGMWALAEQVIDEAEGHVILYCLTIREVDRLHAHLRDYLDGRPVMLRKFHGNLSEIEKASTGNEFAEAPRVGDEGYAQMIFVATSAFGLGIDRDDIWTVFCVSPATDLAALYQQLGRGGRDVAGRPIAEVDRPTYALALATSRTLDTAEWLASLDLPAALLERFARIVLAAANRNVLDPTARIDYLLRQEVERGRLSEAAAREPRLREVWKTGLVRAVAALADLGVLVDHGDLPERVQVIAGTRPAVDILQAAVRDVILDLPVRGTGLHSANLPITQLHSLLSTDGRTSSIYTAQVDHPASLWLLLCDMHDASVVDVSQRPNMRTLIGLSRPGWVSTAGASVDEADIPDERSASALPVGYTKRISAKMARAAQEAAHLRAFFAPGTQCLNERFAAYFQVDTPAECCSNEINLCSVCRRRADGPGPAPEGPVHALESVRLRPASYDPAVRAARVDEAITGLLRGLFNGASALQIRLVLRGEVRVWSPTKGGYAVLSPPLRAAPQRGHLPDVTDKEVTDSISRLQLALLIVADGRVWRTSANAAAGPRRLSTRESVARAAAP
jgi:superfamily II DNA helicase RecQ